VCNADEMNWRQDHLRTGSRIDKRLASESSALAEGNIILGAAVIPMLVSGSGLIAPMFYSLRKGYDDPPRSNRIQRE
jgi:hypothetical protein